MVGMVGMNSMDGMRAAVYDRFGPPEVLRVVDDAPRPPDRRGAVRVRVRAMALNPKDVLIRKGKLRLLSGRGFPRTPGVDFAGEVLAAPDGAGLAVGQAVYGMIQSWREGAAAEEVVVPADELAPMPAGLSMVEAAAVPLAALTALQALRDLLHVGPGQRLCVNGASGGVGTFAVQLAADRGAHVVAVCSGRNAALVRELGAAEVVDYTAADPLAPATPYAAFFDVFGNRPYREARRALAPGAPYVTTVPGPRAFVDELRARLGGPPARLVVVRSRRADLAHLSARIEAGALRPVVDRVLPLAQIAEGHRFLETKRARGKVVIELG